LTPARPLAKYRSVRVLGFDPGYGRTGWGVVESGRDASRLVGIAYGVLETLPGGIMADRMAELYRLATEVIAEFEPDYVIMESLFFTKNPTTAAGVYQAQGVLLAAVGESGRPIQELGPGTIKQVIAGSGRAKKAEVTRMVERLLGFREPIRPDDAADALAGAVAGIYHARSENLIEAALKRKADAVASAGRARGGHRKPGGSSR
jgi:crossover junction endodeoxyribonuclease RuvC